MIARRTILRGVVKDGTVVLEGNPALSEGTEVKVIPLLAASSDSGENPADRMPDLAVPGGIPDLSINIDHYLYGHPKVTNPDR